MSLLADYTDSFGGKRTARFPDWATDYLVADLDLSGHSILGLSLDDLEFGAQLAKKIYCGPTIGSAPPTFRYMTAHEVGAQPESTFLTDLENLGDLSALGGNLLILAAPAATSYLRSNHLGVPSFMSSTDVLGDIAQYISTDKNLSPGSDLLISSQRAIKDYVLSRTGGRPPPGITPGPKASGTSVDLDSADEYTVITGTTQIDEFVLAEDEERFVTFDDILTIVASANILTPNGVNITTVANSTALIRGKAGGVVEISVFPEDFLIHYGGDFSTGGPFRTAGQFFAAADFSTNADFNVDGTVQITGPLFIQNAFSTLGAFALTLTTTATTNSTLPAGTHVLLGRDSYATTATAAGTTTLTVADQYQQFFTGATTQTVKLPVTSTLTLGFQFRIVNLSSGSVTVQSSGSNTVVTLTANTAAILTCILTSGTTAASWSAI